MSALRRLPQRWRALVAVGGVGWLLGALGGPALATVTPSYSFIAVYDSRSASTLDGLPLPPGALIDAYDPGGTHCGTWTVPPDGTVGLMAVYHDDSQTTPDEGAATGDTIRFTINGIATRVSVYTQPDGSPGNGGAVTWGTQGDVWDIALTATSMRQLQFAQVPALGVSGTWLDPPPMVRMLTNGGVDTAFVDTVQLSLQGAGVLSGPTRVRAVGGLATFPGLAYTAAADGDTFRLVATATDSGTPLPAITSAVIAADVVATHLHFATQPGAVVDGQPFGVPPVVEARDAAQGLDTDFGGVVALSLAGGTGTLAGGDSAWVALVRGVGVLARATYFGHADGETFQLQVTAPGLVAGRSDWVVNQVVATRLIFATSPQGAVSGAPLTVQPVVRAVNARGLTDIDFADTVYLDATPLRGGGRLGGQTAVQAVAGVATFTDARYDVGADGDIFVLTADDQADRGDDLAPAISDPVTGQGRTDLPVARAGQDTTLVLAGRVQLDGTASHSMTGDALQFRWRAPAGITLSDSTAPQPWAQAAAPGAYPIELRVSDGPVVSAPDTVIVYAWVPAGLTVPLDGAPPLSFRYLERGVFTMGDSLARQAAHPVVLTRPLLMGQFEVTQAQWQAVMGTTPWYGQPWASRSPQAPATYVPWEQVQEFVHRLNQTAGDSLYRLPTEAEWEYACRAGTTTRWSCGDTLKLLDPYAWYAANSAAVGAAAPRLVGTRQPNAWGLYDLHGNVNEWVQDFYRAYASGWQPTDPQGAATGAYRAVRGGSFASLGDGVAPGLSTAASFLSPGDGVPGSISGAVGFVLQATAARRATAAVTGDTALVWGTAATEAATRYWDQGASFDVGFRLVRLCQPEPVQWSVGFTVTGSRGEPVDLRLGLAVAATDGLDASLGEVEQPPLPPETALDARWLLPGAARLGVQRDYRNPAVGPAGVVWELALQQPAGRPPLQLAWDRTGLPPQGSLRLLDAATGGARLDLDLLAQDHCLLPDDGATLLRVEYTPGPAVSHTYELPGPWQLVSLPCALVDASWLAVFPGAVSLFGFGDGYQAAAALAPGVGYWLHTPALGPIRVRGPALPDSVMGRGLPARWSLVGPGFVALDVLALKAAYPSVVSAFGYAEGYYPAATLVPGQGYWVNLSTPTWLDLSGRVAPAPRGRPAAALPLAAGTATLWAEAGDRQQALALGVTADQVVALPPVPPVGLFDVRVQLPSGVGAWQVPTGVGPCPVQLQGGVQRLRWQAAVGGDWELLLDGQVTPLQGTGQVVLTPGASVVVRQRTALPLATQLHGAYPNPFNPSTTLRYDLKQASAVRLRLWAVTGQQVREWYVASQAAGTHQVLWDGCDARGQAVASGVYLAEMQAGDYRAVRRLLLLR